MTSPAVNVPYLDCKRIELASKLLLEDFESARGIELAPPVPVEEILELHLGLSLAIRPLREIFGVDDVLGAIWFESREVLVDEHLDPDAHPDLEGRFRFTLAHEVGHWQLHRHLQRRRPADQPTFLCRTSQARARVEWQADYFAGTLLLPRQLALGAWHARYPSFCPVMDGDCTYTWCATGTVNPPSDCPPTSTSTSTSTTTADPTSSTEEPTTCDCNTSTSTPVPDGCSEGCCFVAIPTGGGWTWHQQTNGCSSICPCPFPDIAAADCQVTFTACVPPPPTTAPPPPPECGGSCRYVGWVTTDCNGVELLSDWILLSDGCLDYPGVPCFCVRPGGPAHTLFTLPALVAQLRQSRQGPIPEHELR